MAFTLAKASTRRNGHGPAVGGPPRPEPLAKPIRRVGVTHPGGEAGGRALARDAHPGDGGVGERRERRAVRRRAAGREDDDPRLVLHAPPAIGSPCDRQSSFSIDRSLFSTWPPGPR